MKKNKKIIILIIGVLILIVLVVCYIFTIFNDKNMNSEKVTGVVSMIASQEEIEEEFEIDGYTIDNPNIIINPYGNSPLTALVIFETSEYVSPTVTIKGDDELSTFTHTFDEGKEHYLPIYGLYADRDNEVIIEYELGDEIVSKSIVITTDKLPDDLKEYLETYQGNIGDGIREFLVNKNKSYSLDQTIKGLFTTGLVKSVKYVHQKLKRKRKK